MRKQEFTTQFKKDAKRVKKRRKKIDKLKTLMTHIIREETLDSSYKDHALKGTLLGYRDAHIEGDWVLIYKITGNTVLFVRTGTHSDLFDS